MNLEQLDSAIIELSETGKTLAEQAMSLYRDGQRKAYGHLHDAISELGKAMNDLQRQRRELREKG